MIAEPQQEQACLYALGALSPDETVAFEQVLRDDAELQEFIHPLQRVTLAMVLHLRPVVLPRRLKARVLDV